MTYKLSASIRLLSTVLTVAFLVGYFISDLDINWVNLPSFLDRAIAFYGRMGQSYLLIPVIFLAWMSFTSMRSQRKKQAETKAEHLHEIGIIEKAISSHAIVSVANRNADIIAVNENFEKTFGYSKQEVLGKSHQLLYGYAESECTFKSVHDTVYKGQVWHGEQKLLARSGKMVITQSTIVPIFDTQGNHSRTISIRTDVTGERIAEAEKNLTSILENMQDEIFLYSVDSLYVIYANKKARERCNWDIETAKSKRITDGAELFNNPVYLNQLNTLLDGECSEATNEFSNGHDYYKCTTRLHTGPDEKPMYVTFLRDITVKRQNELDKMHSVSMVSHELRTPLTSIKGSLQLLQSGAVGEVSKDVGQIIGIAARNSERLLLVVDDILVLEKINSGHMEFAMCVIDLNAFIIDSVEANQGFGDHYNVTFTTQLPEYTAEITADPNRLMQVMSNLMSNAAKFSPKGANVLIALSNYEGAWRISVSDRGPGIPEKARKTLFDSFVQVEPTDGIKRSGTGLGLAITQKIVQRHGGKVDFESVLGAGTTFTVDLPKMKPAKVRDIALEYSNAAE